MAPSNVQKHHPKVQKTITLSVALENAVLRKVKRDTDANEPLTDQTEGSEDELYYGSGTVGEEQQVFTFDFDTGSKV